MNATQTDPPAKKDEAGKPPFPVKAKSKNIKAEGKKHVLYSADGKKVLGRFDKEEDADAHEKELAKKPPTKESAGLALEGGVWVLAEGGRCVLEEGDLRELGDEDLRALRSLMMDKYAARNKAFGKLGDNRYSDPKGAVCMRDMGYYSGVLSRLEGEMAYRLLTLDGEGGDQ